MENEKWLFDALREGLSAAARAATAGGAATSDLGDRVDAIVTDGLQSILAAFHQLEKWEDRTIDRIEELFRLANGYIDQQRHDPAAADDQRHLRLLTTIDEGLDETKRQAQGLLALGQGQIDGGGAAAEQKGIVEAEVDLGGEGAADLEMAKEWLDRDEVLRAFVCCCLSALPDGRPLKRRDLVNWLVGMGADDVEANYFEKMLRGRLIAPCYSRAGAKGVVFEGYALSPSLRSMALSLPRDEGAVSFLQASGRHKIAAVSSASTAGLASVLFNINVGYMKFDTMAAVPGRMENLTVLQLGRWQSSPKGHANLGTSETIIKIVDAAAFCECLGYLKKLRYIGLQGVSGVKELPDAIAKMLDLRALDVQACDDLEKLTFLERERDGSRAAATKMLKNLEYIDVLECYLVKHMPGGLNDLDELKVLKGFPMGYSHPQQGAAATEICSLGKLTKIRKLSLDFGGVVDIEEGELSCLKNLVCLSTLTLSWANFSVHCQTGSGNRKPSEAILALGWLPESLKKLDLRCFPPEEIPSGLVSGKLKNLEKLYFRGGGLQNLQLIAREGAFEQLSILRLRYLENFKNLTLSFLKETFPSLNHLDILNCPLSAQQFFEQSFINDIMGLVYFLTFPENSLVRRSHYVRHVIGCTRKNYEEAEDFADKGLAYLLKQGHIKAMRKKGTTKVIGYLLTLHPSYIRPMAIKLGEELGQLSFGFLGTPSEENQFVSLSLSDMLRFEPLSLLNLNARYLELEEVAKMKTLAYLQLGKWPGYIGSHNDLRAVSPTAFFTALLPLRNLKYLGLQGISEIREIPATISGLISLKILDLRGCPDLLTIHPNGVAALKDLIHLDVSHCNLLENMPPDFQRLTSSLEVMLGLLMKDTDFSLSYFNNKKLRKIALLFCNTKEFGKQNLMFSSPSLRVMTIAWKIEVNVIFPSNCHSLSLDWLPTDIEKLELCNFPKVEKPPTLVPSRFPNLKRFYIVGGSLCSLKDHTQEDIAVWQQVEVLRLRGLKNLEVDWLDIQQLFPALRSAEVVGCPKVTSFPCEADGLWVKSMHDGVSLLQRLGIKQQR